MSHPKKEIKANKEKKQDIQIEWGDRWGQGGSNIW